MQFPEDYRAFLREHDGVARGYGDAWLILYRADELRELNEGRDDQPGLVFIGSDGGGEGVAYDFRQAQPPIFLVNFVSGGWEEAIWQADSFSDFMAQRDDGLPYRFDA